MEYRRFGRTGWMVGEIGYGMWGMGSWSGSDDEESLNSMQQAVELGCNFFDSAWYYGQGHSDKLLGRLVKANPDKRIYTATKISPKNLQWPASSKFKLEDSYPADYIESSIHKQLEVSGLPAFDLLQFHTWDDSWLDDDRSFKKLEELRRQGLINAVGISLNRWEPWNGIRAVRAGVVDSVQVIYNVFDQNPEDELFPACKEADVAVIARVPFDEGSLTGTLNSESKWPEGDWRNVYFTPENLGRTLERVEALKPLLSGEMSLPEMALRFILRNPVVSTTIPGMRKSAHVAANIAASDKGPLPDELHSKLLQHRWNR